MRPYQRCCPLLPPPGLRPRLPDFGSQRLLCRSRPRSAPYASEPGLPQTGDRHLGCLALRRNTDLTLPIRDERKTPVPCLEVTIKTRDGLCPASLFTPAEGAGPWPAVIFFMDGLGIRPVTWEMGQRLADGGYLVLLPDLYYRRGSYPPMIPAQVLADPAARAELMKIVTSLDRDRKISDAAAFRRISIIATR